MSNTEITNKSRNLIDLHRADNQNCPQFSGSTCLEWLCFLPQWQAYMRHLGVEDIIVKGLFNGQPLDTFKQDSKSRPEIFVSYYNSYIRTIKIPDYRKEFSSIFFEFCPWLPYYLEDWPIPVGTRYFYDGRERTVDEPNFQNLEQCLDSFANSYHSFMPENSVYPPEIRNINIGDARSNVMFSMKIEKYVTKFTEEKARSEYLTLDKLIRAITLDSTGEIIDDDDESFSVEVEKADLDAFIEKKLGPAHITEFDRLVVNEHNAQLTLGNSFRAATTTCLKVFKKLDERCLAGVVSLIESGNFVGAYRKLNVTFIKRGMGDTEVFGNDAKAIKLLPGRDLNTHLNLLDKALRRWAQVLYLSKVITAHATKEASASTVHSSKGNLAKKTADYESLVDQSDYDSIIDLSLDEGCIDANVGELTDQAVLKSYPGFLLIPHATRYSILLNSITESSSDRFKSVVTLVSAEPIGQQSIMKLKRQLTNLELSSLGTSNLEDERVKNPNWASQDLPSTLKSGKKRQREESATTATVANIASTQPAKKATTEVFPAGSCIHHPKSTTHRTEDCKNAGAGKKKGSNKKASAGTGSAAAAAPPPSTTAIKTHASSTLSCAYCLQRGRPAFNTHTEDRCFVKFPHLRPTAPRANQASASSNFNSSSDNSQVLLAAIQQLSRKFDNATVFEDRK